MTLINISKRKFNNLCVIGLFEISYRGEAHWLTRCDCGNFVIVNGVKIRSGHTRSCGCLQREMVSKVGKGIFTHKMSDTRFYRIWRHILNRCNNKNIDHYDRYGGRGIRICYEWYNFTKFKKDMYSNYITHCIKFGEKNTTIDRIDNDGNYVFSNCRWATYEVQRNNRRDTVRIGDFT